MRLILAAVSICLLSSCSGLADSIRKNQQKKQVYQQYSAKYYAACQKEAFNYYPVAIVKRDKPQVVTQKPNNSFSCTKWGNTVDCQDTTSRGYEGLIQATNEGLDMLAGKTSTYDANAGSRGNHLKSCIDNNLRNDTQFTRATNSVNVGYQKASSNYTGKLNSNYTPNSAFDLNKKTLALGKKEYRLNGYKKNGLLFDCFYGDKKEHLQSTINLPCNPTAGFFPLKP